MIKRIRNRISGEFDCPACWHETGMEDCDEGCNLNHKFECWKCLWRFFPKRIIKLAMNIFMSIENLWLKYLYLMYENKE